MLPQPFYAATRKLAYRDISFPDECRIAVTPFGYCLGDGTGAPASRLRTEFETSKSGAVLTLKG